MSTLSSGSHRMRVALLLLLWVNLNNAFIALQQQYRSALPYSSTIIESNYHHQSYRMDGILSMRHPSTIHPILVDPKKVMLSDDFARVDTRLPWDQSIAPNRELSYMPLLTHLLEVMHRNGMHEVQLEKKFQYKESEVKPARIGNMCFESHLFRKIRVTYFDGGDSVQVLNALWYPHYTYDLPVLGIDLISLGKNRVLNVIDFQPLQTSTEYSHKYIEHLTAIRNKYPELQGTLSGKIYDDTSFFSKNMLFGRFTDESKIATLLTPAYEEYIDAYITLINNTPPDYSEEKQTYVKSRQAAYDSYSAIKDPAVGLFHAYFGKEWSKSFVHDFLFTLSETETGPSIAHGATVKPVHNFKINDATGVVSIKSDANRDR